MIQYSNIFVIYFTLHLRRLRRRRALGVRSIVRDASPAADARERRDARGIGTELGVENSG